MSSHRGVPVAKCVYKGERVWAGGAMCPCACASGRCVYFHRAGGVGGSSAKLKVMRTRVGLPQDETGERRLRPHWLTKHLTCSLAQEFTSLALLPFPPSSPPPTHPFPQCPNSVVTAYWAGPCKRPSLLPWVTYLWPRLLHEALFEVIPGEEWQELGRERQNLTPCSSLGA